MELAERPDLIIPLGVWARPLELMRLCPDEVSVFGFVEVQDPRTIRLYDLATPDQTVTAGSVDELGYGFHQVQNEADRMGRLDDLNFVWHSHPNAIGAQLSFDDVRAMHAIGEVGGQWFISMVSTRLGHVSAKLFQFDPFWLDVDLRVWCDIGSGDSVRDACVQELLAHVTRRVPVPAMAGQPMSFDTHLIRPDELQLTAPRAGLIRLDNGRF